MDFALDWPAFALVLTAAIATAISLKRFSWSLVAGIVSLLALFAVADQFPSVSPYICGMGIFCAVGIIYAARGRLREGLAITIFGLIYIGIISAPHIYRWYAEAALLTGMLCWVAWRVLSKAR